MSEWSPIKYRGFHDVPRVFLTVYDKRTYLFECPWLADIEVEADFYKAYLMPEIQEDDLPKDWTTLAARAIRYLGDIPVAKVKFDPTLRQAVNTEVFDLIPALQASNK